MDNHEQTETLILGTSSQETQAILLAKAEIDVQISTAKAFPRDIAKFYKKALSMATVNEEIAASCTYMLPRDGKNIEGPSVRLAEIITAAYGNIRSGFRVISNDGKKITAQGVCHDLESNTAVTIEVSKRITNRKGQTFSEDMQIVTGNAAGATAYRNAVFKVVPMAFINDIWEQAKVVARGTVATLEKRRNAAIAYFNSIGIKNEQIFKVLGVSDVEGIDLDKLQTLSGYKTAIKNGEAKAKDIFDPEPNHDPAATTDAKKKATDDLARIQHNKKIRDEIQKKEREQEGLKPDDDRYIILTAEIEELQSKIQKEQ